MDQKKPKSVWWVLLAVLWALVAPGCAFDPPMTYNEMTDAAQTEVDPEIKARLDERIAKFERDAERASIYFNNRRACTSGQHREVIWFCQGQERFNERRPPQTLDERVRLYRWDSRNCGCVNRKELFRSL